MKIGKTGIAKRKAWEDSKKEKKKKEEVERKQTKTCKSKKIRVHLLVLFCFCLSFSFFFSFMEPRWNQGLKNQRKLSERTDIKGIESTDLK